MPPRCSGRRFAVSPPASRPRPFLRSSYSFSSPSAMCGIPTGRPSPPRRTSRGTARHGHPSRTPAISSHFYAVLETSNLRKIHRYTRRKHYINRSIHQRDHPVIRRRNQNELRLASITKQPPQFLRDTRPSTSDAPPQLLVATSSLNQPSLHSPRLSITNARPMSTSMNHDTIPRRTRKEDCCNLPLSQMSAFKRRDSTRQADNTVTLAYLYTGRIDQKLHFRRVPTSNSSRKRTLQLLRYTRPHKVGLLSVSFCGNVQHQLRRTRTPSHTDQTKHSVQTLPCYRLNRSFEPTRSTRQADKSIESNTDYRLSINDLIERLREIPQLHLSEPSAAR